MKYLSSLRQYYFNDPKISPAARVDFSWAAYNAGPAKVNSLRRKAAKRGFDPNVWFGNVEKIAAEVIGRETVMYVANINKYYIAYKLIQETDKQKAKLIKGQAATEPSPEAKTEKRSSTPAQADDVKTTTAPQPARWSVKKSLKLETAKSAAGYGADSAEGNSGHNTSSSTRETHYHTVKAGETLYRISRRYGISVNKLMGLNNLGSSAINPGDRIKVSN